LKAKTLILLSIFLLSAVLVLAAGQKGSKEEIHGTWVNSEYKKIRPQQQLQ
jgi:uncharacterized lipoprotein YddW (UPF0748 family)